MHAGKAGKVWTWAEFLAHVRRTGRVYLQVPTDAESAAEEAVELTRAEFVRVAAGWGNFRCDPAATCGSMIIDRYGDILVTKEVTE